METNTDKTIFNTFYEGYTEHKNRCEFLKSSYIGGKKFITDATLPKFGKEGDAAYPNRKDRAVYFNFVAKTVDTILRIISAKKSEIDINAEKIKDFADNCNLAGKSLVDFGLKCLTNAIITGKQLVIFDATKKENEEDKVQDYLAFVEPWQLYDFRKDVQGNYTYAAIAENYYDEGLKSSKVRIVCWYEDRFEVWKLDKDNKAYKAEEGANPFEQVPLYELDFEYSLIEDVADLAVRYMQIDSLIDDEFNVSLYPLHVMPEGVKGQTNKKGQLDLSNSNGITVPPDSNGNLPKIIEVTPNYVQVKQQYLQDLRTEITRLSGLNFTYDENSYIARSGESKKWDFLLTNANMVELCNTLGTFLTDIAREKARRDEVKELDAINITFPDSFNLTTDAEELETIIKLEEANISDTLVKEAKKAYIKRHAQELGLTEDLVKTIENEIDAYTKPTDTGLFNYTINGDTE